MFSRSFAPKESTIFQTKIYPRRIGVGRLYVAYISADTCSLIQSIPIEITSEPIKTPEEPLLKTTTIETKSESPSDKQEPLVREEETKQASMTLHEVEHPIELPSKSPSIADEDDDDVDELYLKKKRNYLHGNVTSVLHDSTLSLDKDKMSVDSLDVSNDRRHLPTNR